MRIDAFDFELPEDRIAQAPLEERDAARLLVIPKAQAPFLDRALPDLPNLLPEGSVVVVNDTRVVPARLFGTKATGGRVEIFLLERRAIETIGTETWAALGRSSKALREGTVISCEGLDVTILGRIEGATLEVRVKTRTGEPVSTALAREGHVPLPPYIKRGDTAVDRERYQTIFAREEGAVAAPTAGLHLTERLVERLRDRRMSIARVTLHVGLGTFQPVTVDDLDDHPMHSERFTITDEAASLVTTAKREGRPIVAIGTTVVRALESGAPNEDGVGLRATTGDTRILIQPGYRFRIVDGLLTNFHLPRSTLLALVSAFGTTERVLEAYRHAVREGYRFFSYGDAMLLLP